MSTKIFLTVWVGIGSVMMLLAIRSTANWGKDSWLDTLILPLFYVFVWMGIGIILVGIWGTK